MNDALQVPVERPVAIVRMLTPSVNASITSSKGPSPRLNGSPKTIDTVATTGIVRPMLASADPSARLNEDCSRSASAARMAAKPSGISTSRAIATPIALFGAPTVCEQMLDAGAQDLGETDDGDERNQEQHAA